MVLSEWFLSLNSEDKGKVASIFSCFSIDHPH